MTPMGTTYLKNAQTYALRHPEKGAAMLAAMTPQPVPPAAALAVQAFETLSAQRGAAFDGPAALSMSDVQSYTTTVQALTPREVRWVFAMDRVWMTESVQHG